jgi:uncharacterized protein YndB with AHSA1/START domain
VTVDDELSRTGSRSVLRMQRRLAHPPKRVWAALTEPDRLAEWFPATVVAELRVGGSVEFGAGPPGTVTDLDPPTLIAYTWGEDHLRWEVARDGDGSVLRLVHTFADRAGAASFASGWHVCLAAMALALAGRPGADHGIDQDTLHERYVTELGLDRCQVDEVGDGWRVRLQRQLTRPADRVRPDLAAAWPGAVVVTDGPDGLEQQVEGGRLRWELGEGTGQGARLTATWTGRDPAARDAAAARIPAVAAALSRP